MIGTIHERELAGSGSGGAGYCAHESYNRGPRVANDLSDSCWHRNQPA